MPRKYSRVRRRSSKKSKKNTKRSKSKKIRGGVTRRRKVADLTSEIGLGHGGSLNTRIKEFVRPVLTNQSINQAVRDYLAGGARKQRVVTKYGDISNWDTSSVTNMNHMFHYAESFNQPLNKWNVSKVTSMNAMFYRAPSFNQPLNKWNVSKVTDMYAMFDDARSFNQTLNKWNVSNVEDMRGMFNEAISFNQPLHAPWYA